MRANATVKRQGATLRMNVLMPVPAGAVVGIDDRKEERIEQMLDSTARVRGCTAVVRVRDLFAPTCRAAVVIRRRNGSYECY